MTLWKKMRKMEAKLPQVFATLHLTSSQMLAQMVFPVMIRGDASREKGPKGRGRGPAGSVSDPNLEE